jgi:cytochrome c
MPSQKGQVTSEELGAIGKYVYKYYDQEKFMADLQVKAAFEALPKGEQLATRNGCLTCHDMKEDKTAPSFQAISKKDKIEIEKVIKNGSKGTWKGFEKTMMPPYKKLSKDEIEIISNWIKTI